MQLFHFTSASCCSEFLCSNSNNNNIINWCKALRSFKLKSCVIRSYFKRKFESYTIKFGITSVDRSHGAYPFSNVWCTIHDKSDIIPAIKIILIIRITPWNSVVLKKLTFAKILKEFPLFCVRQRIYTDTQMARHENFLSPTNPVINDFPKNTFYYLLSIARSKTDLFS
jgi:hypothetical protein